MSHEHNTQQIYRLMEGLNVSMKEIAKDWNTTIKETKHIIDGGMPNAETAELCDRILCIHIEKERKLDCEDAELHEELMDYLMEQPSSEIRYHLSWYYDNLIVDAMEEAEIEARKIAEKAESICNNLARLQRVYYQGKAARE